MSKHSDIQAESSKHFQRSSLARGQNLAQEKGKRSLGKNAGVGLGKYRRALTPRLEKWIFLVGNEKPFGGLLRVGDIALFSSDYSGGLGKQERLEEGTPVRKLEHWLRGQALKN